MLELASPWCLLFLPVPWLIWLCFRAGHNSLMLAVKVPFFHLLQLKPSSAHKPWYWFMIWSLLIFALAGPRWVGLPETLLRNGYNIMLALDISPSMSMNDLVWNGHAVSRFQVVQYTAEKFVSERVDDRIGLILFGERAFLLTPLTYDHQNVLHRLEDATVGLAGKSTSIGDALGLAIKRLQQAPANGRVIILLTDGVNNSGVLSPIKAAELAKTENIKIYTIGLGANDSQALFDQAFFNSAAAELDEQTLQKIAQITDGQYFRATSLQSLEAIYQKIHHIEKISLDNTEFRPRHEYYPWPLAFAWLLWLGRMIWRRRI